MQRMAIKTNCEGATMTRVARRLICAIEDALLAVIPLDWVRVSDILAPVLREEKQNSKPTPPYNVQPSAIPKQRLLVGHIIAGLTQVPKPNYPGLANMAEGNLTGTEEEWARRKSEGVRPPVSKHTTRTIR